MPWSSFSSTSNCLPAMKAASDAGRRWIRASRTAILEAALGQQRLDVGARAPLKVPNHGRHDVTIASERRRKVVRAGEGTAQHLGAEQAERGAHARHERGAVARIAHEHDPPPTELGELDHGDRVVKHEAALAHSLD